MTRLYQSLFVLLASAVLAAGQRSHIPPPEAARSMTLPPGFNVQIIAGEPEVRQPIAMTFDDRGRLWVVENTSYPTCPGPETNRVLIFDDPDDDGSFRKRTVFTDKLTFCSGIEIGFGGVWLGCPPNLLFIPDRNADDRPDAAAEIVLDGFGFQDVHETLSNFIWGPDGWLYGCHGNLAKSKIARPGGAAAARAVMEDGGVWRYHPTKKLFEIYATGGINPWGLDFNEWGQGFISASVLPHIHFLVQGAIYQRRKNRELYLDELKSIPDHLHYSAGSWDKSRARTDGTIDAGGGHAHAGLCLYLGDNFPARYRGTVFQNNLFGNCVNNDVLVRHGSGYIAKHTNDLLRANDGWFRGVGVKYGPDGALYLLDWHDHNECHNFKEVDRADGRIYRVAHGTPRTKRPELQRISVRNAIEAQTTPDEWLARRARRILQERGSTDESRAPLSLLLTNQSALVRVRGLWTAHVTGHLSDQLLLARLGDSNEFVRAWAVQLGCESKAPSSAVIAKLHALANDDKSPTVRLHLACAAQRLGIEPRWPIVQSLSADAQNASDPNIPLALWAAIEPALKQEPRRALALTSSTKIPLLRQLITQRMVSRN